METEAPTRNGVTLMKRYKVVKKPGHWPSHCEFGWMNKIGTAQWFYPDEDKAAVNLYFGNNIERTLPCDCLERVDEPESNMPLNIGNVKIGESYKVVGIPSFWKDATHPELGNIGKVKAVRAGGCLLYFNNEQTNQRFITYDCLESAKQDQPTLNDDILVVRILDNPWGALRIVKGLAKMSRDIKLRAFIEKGMI